MRKLDELNAMLAQVREAPDLEETFVDMGFSAEQAKALAENKSVVQARALANKDQ